jgi:hypothetical protein
MIASNRVAWISALLVALGLGAAHTQPTWLARHGLDWWNLPELQRQTESEQARQAELARHFEIVNRRIRAKVMIVREVVAGQLSLLEAAAWFRDVNAADPDYACIQCLFPGKTEPERLCRQVLSWARGELNDRPTSQAETIQQALEEEFEKLQKRPGGIHFPGE